MSSYRQIHETIYELAKQRNWLPKDVDVNSTGLYLGYGDDYYIFQMDAIMTHMNLWKVSHDNAAEYLKEIILYYYPNIFDDKRCSFKFGNKIILELNIKTLS